MKPFRSLRLSSYCAILSCIAFVQFSAKSNVIPTSQVTHTLTGNIHLHENFHSQYLKNSRNIIVYLPPGYDSSPNRRYPVLYMQDGQNIFDVATSFFFSRERHVDEKAEELITRQVIEPLIIVGVYSVAYDRLNEYTPTPQPGSHVGGHADIYGRMLVDEVKPFIDAHYRTLKDPSHTGLSGSSLGGLTTLYIGLKYPNVFGKLSMTSPAAYWDNEMIVQYVKSLPAKTNQRICLTVGTGEPDHFLNTTRDLREALIHKGWKLGVSFGYMEADGFEHAPNDTGRRASYLLKFLFPAAK